MYTMKTTEQLEQEARYDALHGRLPKQNADIIYENAYDIAVAHHLAANYLDHNGSHPQPQFFSPDP